MNELTLAGQELRQRREALGLTFDDAYLRTRIAPAYLKALEEGNLSELPEPCYAVGFVRTYCQALELEPEWFVDRYLAVARRAGRSTRPSGPTPRSGLADVLTQPRVLLPSWAGQAATWLVVCSIVALGWFAYTVVFRPTNPSAGRAQASTMDMVVPSDLDTPAK